MKRILILLTLLMSINTFAGYEYVESEGDWKTADYIITIYLGSAGNQTGKEVLVKTYYTIEYIEDPISRILNIKTSERQTLIRNLPYIITDNYKKK